MSSLSRWGLSSTITVASFALDAATTKAAARLLYARDAIPVSVTLSIAQVTGTAPTYAVRIETDDGTGRPSGALYDANATGTFTPTADGYYTIAFATAPAALAANTIYHIVVQHSAGTVNGSNYAKVGYNTSSLWGACASFTFQQNTGAGWSVPSDTGQMVVGITYTGGEQQTNLCGTKSATAVWGTIRTGLRFQLPFAAEVTALTLRLYRLGAPSNLRLKVLDSSGNVVATMDVLATLIPTSGPTQFDFYLANVLQLSANQTYRFVACTALGTEASAADAYYLQAVQFASAGASWEGGTSFLTTADADTGPWTDSTEQEIVGGVVFESMVGTTTLNTIDDVLDEGNWQADAWSPRVADDTEFRAFVAGIVSRANAYVKWRVGDAYYSAQAGSTIERIFREAELQLAQYLLCMSAAKIADTSDHDGSAPWLKDGQALRETAQQHQTRVEELLAPYDTVRGRPGRVGPYFRGVTTAGQVVERFVAG